MSLKETLTQDMKAAMKARDSERLGTIRMLLSNLKNLEISQRTGTDVIDEQAELTFLATEAKRRRESIEAYEKAERQDLADKEAAELAVIETYLPRQLTPEEARGVVDEAIAETGASGPADMGRVMKVVIPRLKGRFPGKDVKGLVDSALAGR